MSISAKRVKKACITSLHVILRFTVKKKFAPGQIFVKDDASMMYHCIIQKLGFGEQDTRINWFFQNSGLENVSVYSLIFV